MLYMHSTLDNSQYPTTVAICVVQSDSLFQGWQQDWEAGHTTDTV